MSLSQEDIADALTKLWAHIVNWQDDVVCGVKPLETSLYRAREIAEKALARNDTPIVGHHPVMTRSDPHHRPPATVIFDDREVPALEKTQ